MISDNLLNPFGTDPRTELPIAPVDQPLWTEYFYFHCYDPDQDTGISMHMGREPHDPSLYRATMGIYVPGGDELLSVKTIGRGGHARGGGTGILDVTCVEPLRLWTVEFDGMVQPSTRSENMSSSHRDSVAIPAKVYLRYEARGPYWDLHAHMHGQKWGSEHYEQLCKVTGEIEFGGKTYPINNGFGIRDHSRGPRDYAPVVSNLWANFSFPSGACIMVQYLVVDGSEIVKAYIFRGDGSPLEVVEVVETPYISTRETPDHSCEKDPLLDPSLKQFKLVLKSSKGLETIEGELLHSFATTYISPNDELIGTALDVIDRGQSEALQLTESACKYTWNGEVGYGTRERVIKLRALK
jgi:hypothetical protein